MPNLLAMSFEGQFAPSFHLRCLEPGKNPPDGWGIGYYPDGEPCAPVLKEPAPRSGSIRSQIVRAWDHLESSLFVLHIRRATWGQPSDANTQPFQRTHGGREWLFAHAGSLSRRLDLDRSVRFEPVGSTDSERVFCHLLDKIAATGSRSLSEVPMEQLHGWLRDLNAWGTLNVTLTDGHDLVVYADGASKGGLQMWELRPPYGSIVFGDDDVQVDLTRRGIKSRKGILVSSDPLAGDEGVHTAWERLLPGELVRIRQGAILSRHQPVSNVTERPSGAWTVRKPERSPTHRYKLIHETIYRYSRPVERSVHLLRLFPVVDRHQQVDAFDLRVSVDGQVNDYDDVFGNKVRRVLLETPFTELKIQLEAQITLFDTEPIGLLRRRSHIPLVWMPWQSHMLQPYLLPPELPETQLSELVEYAMSFVERNDYDLLETLLDMTATIRREFKYSQGSTHLRTTAFEVYSTRAGVCQDFANLFICMARLLGIPARYVCGYIYTGNLDNTAQGDASHAWVEVYLPDIGWRGFDPTNGIATHTDHARVAVGRTYVDATPTSGTIYVGGGGEQLGVQVRMERL
jgi:transglutaminase-like putative cysteine protease/predicted glutamine amidotransferase